MKSAYRQQYSNVSHDHYSMHWLLPLQHAALGKHYCVYKATRPRVRHNVSHRSLTAAVPQQTTPDKALSLQLLICAKAGTNLQL